MDGASLNSSDTNEDSRTSELGHQDKPNNFRQVEGGNLRSGLGPHQQESYIFSPPVSKTTHSEPERACSLQVTTQNSVVLPAVNADGEEFWAGTNNPDVLSLDASPRESLPLAEKVKLFEVAALPDLHPLSPPTPAGSQDKPTSASSLPYSDADNFSRRVPFPCSILPLESDITSPIMSSSITETGSSATDNSDPPSASQEHIEIPTTEASLPAADVPGSPTDLPDIDDQSPYDNLHGPAVRASSLITGLTEGKSVTENDGLASHSNVLSGNNPSAGFAYIDDVPGNSEEPFSPLTDKLFQIQGQPGGGVNSDIKLFSATSTNSTDTDAGCATVLSQLNSSSLASSPVLDNDSSRVSPSRALSNSEIPHLSSLHDPQSTTFDLRRERPVTDLASNVSGKTNGTSSVTGSGEDKAAPSDSIDSVANARVEIQDELQNIIKELRLLSAPEHLELEDDDVKETTGELLKAADVLSLTSFTPGARHLTPGLRSDTCDLSPISELNEPSGTTDKTTEPDYVNILDEVLAETEKSHPLPVNTLVPWRDSNLNSTRQSSSFDNNDKHLVLEGGAPRSQRADRAQGEILGYPVRTNSHETGYSQRDTAGTQDKIPHTGIVKTASTGSNSPSQKHVTFYINNILEPNKARREKTQAASDPNNPDHITHHTNSRQNLRNAFFNQVPEKPQRPLSVELRRSNGVSDKRPRTASAPVDSDVFLQFKDSNSKTPEDSVALCKFTDDKVEGNEGQKMLTSKMNTRNEDGGLTSDNKISSASDGETNMAFVLDSPLVVQKQRGQDELQETDVQKYQNLPKEIIEKLRRLEMYERNIGTLPTRLYSTSDMMTLAKQMRNKLRKGWHSLEEFPSEFSPLTGLGIARETRAKQKEGAVASPAAKFTFDESDTCVDHPEQPTGSPEYPCRLAEAEEDTLSLEFYVPGKMKYIRLHRRTFIRFVLKYLIFFFTFIFWVASLLGIGFGSWMLTTNSVVIDDVTDVFLDPYVLLCVVGTIIFLVAFLGCVGALRENIWLLKLFHISLTAVLVLEVLLSTLVFLFYTMPEFRMAVKVGPEEVLKKAVKEYFDNEAMKNWIDNVQKQGEYINYMCGAGIISADISYVTHMINTKGCMKSFGEWLAKNDAVIGYVGLGVIIPQILGVLAARRFIKTLHARKNDQELQSDAVQIVSPE